MDVGFAPCVVMIVIFVAVVIMTVIAVLVRMVIMFVVTFCMIFVSVLTIMLMIFISMIVPVLVISFFDGFSLGFNDVFCSSRNVLDFGLHRFGHLSDDWRCFHADVLRCFRGGLAGGEGEATDREEKERPRHVRLQLLFDRFGCGDYLAQTLI